MVDKIKSYKELIVWQKSMDLVTMIYKDLNLPEEEKFGIQSQIRRSSVSVPSNIAEGWGRSSKSFINFLKISRGSLYELETQILILKDLNYLKDSSAIESLIVEISKMLSSLISKIGKSL